MNWPLFVARRLSSRSQRSFSTAIVRLAIAAVGLSSAVMIIALATVSGFQSGIKNKVIGMNGHIVIDDISNTEGSEPLPIASGRQAFTRDIEKVKGIRSVSLVALRPCIARGGDEIDGMVAKGVSTSYNLQFFGQHLLQGELPDFSEDSNTALISDVTARRLKLKTGDRIQAIFIKQDSSGNSRARAINPVITGIFNTGLDEYDRTLILTHISQVRKVLPKGTSFTQWELLLNSSDSASLVADQLTATLPAGVFNINTAQRYNRQIFDWLALLDTNVVIIISLMLLVAAIGMCTTLLILITERTQMIGTLKALGAGNGSLRSIFIFQVIFITVGGLLLGNTIGIGLCLIQQQYGLITLNTETYYVNKVLIDIQPMAILLVNAGTIVLCSLVLFLPAGVIGRLSPIRVMRFQ